MTPYLFYILAICGTLPQNRILHEPAQEAFNICVVIASTAIEQELDPFTLVSLGYPASRMDMDALSSAGAIGPMQVLPQYHCYSYTADCERLEPLAVEDCDLILSGVCAYKRYYHRHNGDREAAIAHYNGGGNYGESSRRYARAVIRTAESLRRLMYIPYY